MPKSPPASITPPARPANAPEMSERSTAVGGCGDPGALRRSLVVSQHAKTEAPDRSRRARNRAARRHEREERRDRELVAEPRDARDPRVRIELLADLLPVGTALRSVRAAATGSSGRSRRVGWPTVTSSNVVRTSGTLRRYSSTAAIPAHSAPPTADATSRQHDHDRDRVHPSWCRRTSANAAPMKTWPSWPMLTRPARFEMIVPSATSSSGTATPIVAPMRPGPRRLPSISALKTSTALPPVDLDDDRREHQCPAITQSA